MKKSQLLISLGSVILIVIVIFLPTPLLIRGPGNLISLEKGVEVNQERDQKSGAFYVTVVQTRSATLLEMLWTINDPFREIVNQERATNGLPTEASRLLQGNAMNTSQNSAKKVALNLANKEGDLAYQGIFILTASKDSGLKDQLVAGDGIVTLDEQSFEHSSEIGDYLQALPIGQEVRFKIQRGPDQKTVKGKVTLNESTGRHSLGIQFFDRTVLTSEVPIEVELGAVGGPSAGLMLTLQMYGMISGNDLREGRDIAGTGAINLEGQVTRVGGVAEKVYSASKSGVKAFLVPDDNISAEFQEYFPEVQSNYQEALEAKAKLSTKMEIVPVKTVQEAIEWLRK